MAHTRCEVGHCSWLLFRFLAVNAARVALTTLALIAIRSRFEACCCPLSIFPSRNQCRLAFEQKRRIMVPSLIVIITIILGCKQYIVGSVEPCFGIQKTENFCVSQGHACIKSAHMNFRFCGCPSGSSAG